MNEIINKIFEMCKKEKRICIISLVIFLSIRIVYSIYLYEYKYEEDDTTRKMYVKVLEKQKETDEKISYLVEFENNRFIMNNYINENINEREYYNKNDILKIRGKVVIPKLLNNPYEFNYKRYLNSQNIIGIINVSSIKKIGISKKIDFNILSKFREELLNKADEILDEDEKTLFNSMICGIKDYSNTEVKEYFFESGSSHYLSISGTHIIYFLNIIEIFIKNMNKNLKKYIKIIFVILFNIMIGYQVSLVRASIMYIISNLNIKESKKNKVFKLFISAMIIISYNPYSIFNSSFIFSFLSIIGIQIFSPLINSYFDMLVLRLFDLKYMDSNFLKLSSFNRVIYFAVNYILKSISFGLSVQIVTLPFQMYFFCEVNFIAIISNILLTPLITFEFIIGFLAFFLIYIPYVGTTLLLANKSILSTIIFFVENLSKLEFLKISVIKPDFLSITFYYLILIIHLFSKYLYKFFDITRAKKIKIWIKPVTFILILYIISMYIKVLFFEEYVYFFNVGQGNMALLHKNNTNIVVDLGSTSKGVASNVLLNFLKAKNISKIDMLIITHMHDDHMNGVSEVIENVKVSKVLFSNFENKGETKNNEFERMVKNKNISVINVAKEDKILFRDFQIDLLSPPKDEIIDSSDILNSNSLVLIISKGNHNYLFLGDATKETEKYMFDKDIYHNNIYDKLRKLDAIQIGHHGSNTSTSEILLKNINSCTAIISSEKKKFGHPSKETLEVLEKYQFDIKITENEGAVKIK